MFFNGWISPWKQSTVLDNLKVNKAIFIAKQHHYIQGGSEERGRDKSNLFRYSKYLSCEITETKEQYVWEALA